MWTAVWVAVGVGVVASGLIAAALLRPAARRKQAVREALAAARAEAERDPSPSARVRLAKVYLQLSDQPEEALGILEDVLREDPYQWADDEKPARMLEAEAYVALGQLERAIERFEQFVADVPRYDTGGDKERKWKLETHKVEAEQRIRLLRRGDTHVHQPEQWGDAP